MASGFGSERASGLRVQGLGEGIRQKFGHLRRVATFAVMSKAFCASALPDFSII